MVVADFLLFGIEADALADDGGFWACRTPYGKGHLEADGEDALGAFTSAGAERVPEYVMGKLMEVWVVCCIGLNALAS